MRLGDGATIEGPVVEESGQPKTRIWIRATVGTKLTGGNSDAQGRFSLHGLPDEGIRIEIIHGKRILCGIGRAGMHDVDLVLSEEDSKRIP